MKGFNSQDLRGVLQIGSRKVNGGAGIGRNTSIFKKPGEGDVVRCADGSKCSEGELGRATAELPSTERRSLT